MSYILKNATVYKNNKFQKMDLFVENGLISDSKPHDALSLDFNNCVIFPGFVDVHVHLRQPGFFYKETIQSGTSAGARGGYTTVFSMPNLNPVPDSLKNLQVQLDAIKTDAVIDVCPYGAITKNQEGLELADLEEIAPFVYGFSDDGKGVQNQETMLLAMRKAKQLNKPIVAHCEDNSLLFGGYIHQGSYAKAHNHKGISSESEWKQLERDIELVRQTRCSYHICHVSTKESVEIIRQAKKEGLDVTAETAPHYLVLCDENLQDEGRFKMNPPLRCVADRDALVEGLIDGTIDMIATDHAPHSFEEKSKGLKDSLMGIVGLEVAFAVLYTNLVKTGKVTLECILDALTTKPAKRFGIESGLNVGQVADLTVFDLNKEYKIDSNNFLSMGKSTPFENELVCGECVCTMKNGKIVWGKI